MSVNVNSIVQHVIQNKKWNNKTRQCECKNYYKSKKDYSWNPNACICENSKYLKNMADASVTKCDEIIILMDTIATNTITTANTIDKDKDKYYSDECYEYCFNKFS